MESLEIFGIISIIPHHDELNRNSNMYNAVTGVAVTGVAVHVI